MSVLEHQGPTHTFEFDETTIGDHTLFAGIAGAKLRIVGGLLIVGGAETVTFKDTAGNVLIGALRYGAAGQGFSGQFPSGLGEVTVAGEGIRMTLGTGGVGAGGALVVQEVK